MPTPAPKKKKRPVIKLKITEAHDKPDVQARPSPKKLTSNDTVNGVDKGILEPNENPSSIH